MKVEHIKFTPKIRAAIWSWHKQMPRRLRNNMPDNADDFFAELFPNLNAGYFAGGLKMFFTSEEKESGIFETHFYSGRHLTAADIYNGFHTYERWVYHSTNCEKMLFDVCALQKTVSDALLKVNVVFTGWRFRESRVTFEKYIWERKSVAEKVKIS